MKQQHMTYRAQLGRYTRQDGTFRQIWRQPDLVYRGLSLNSKPSGGFAATQGAEENNGAHLPITTLSSNALITEYIRR
jgi:hypothetical protein